MERPDGFDQESRARGGIWRAVGVIATGGFLLGLVLLVLAVYLPLPGVLTRWNDSTAWEPVALQVAFGILAFGAWAWPNRHRERAFSLVFLALGTATVLILGTAGFLSCPDPALSTGWSVASRVIGFVLGTYDVEDFRTGECGPGVPLALQFARLVQLVVLLVAASRAVAALLRGQLDRILVRAARRIVLVVGADATSAQLLPAIAAERRQLVGFGATHVIVTSDLAAPWVRRARATGWRAVAGDATDVGVLRPLLRRGRRHHALVSLAVLAADSTTTQRLMRAVELAVGGTRSAGPVRALLRIDDAWQAEDWRRRYLGRAAEWVVDTISADEVTARLIVEDALRSGSDRLVVAGSSGLTFALLAEVAQQARERLTLGEAAVPEIVLLDPAASNMLEQHRFSQGRFGNAAELRARAIDKPATTESIEAAVRGAAAPAILFTGDPGAGSSATGGPAAGNASAGSASAGTSAAGEGAPAVQRLAALLGVHSPDRLIYSRLGGVAGLGAEPLLARVYGYGSTLDAGGRLVGRWERIARLGHERYVRAHPDPDIPSRRPWAALPPFYRDSNVRQVLATLESAVAVGRSWGAGPARGGTETRGAETAGEADTLPDDGQLARMAELEHESWRRHLLESGWRPGPTRDDARRWHPDLVPWADLGEEAREKTRIGVITTLELLATLGYRSFDDPVAPWRTIRRRGEVWARRRDDAWEWRTHSGQRLRGAPGDWEVLDSRGRAHSVAAEVFALSHERIDGNRWRRTGTVEVRPAREAERIETLEGPVLAGTGEWVVRGSLGDEWVISAERLAAGYELGDLS